MEQSQDRPPDGYDVAPVQKGGTCSVNMTLNFLIGAAAVAAGIFLIWLAWTSLGG